MVTEHLYAGCPDLIGEIGGVKVIADFKTSNGPYSASSLIRVTVWVSEVGENIISVLNRWRLTASHLEERTGYKCDVALIIVSTPETTQGIFIDGDQMDLFEAKFLKRVKQFHDMESEENTESSS